ncbi:hypothetical protein SERLA73DRAFT_61014, partial [Serpula lacrymans var. lacrymans S7.3]
GKMAVFYGLLFTMQELACKPIGVGPLLDKPVILIVTVLNTLGDTQAAEMNNPGIKAVLVHSSSIQAAKLKEKNLVDKIQ